MAQNYNGFGSGEGGGINNDLYLHLYRWPFYVSFVTEASSYVIKSHEWMNEWMGWMTKIKGKVFFSQLSNFTSYGFDHGGSTVKTGKKGEACHWLLKQ